MRPKYYTYNEYDDSDDGKLVTLSEREIIDSYYEFWYDAMCKKFGKEVVDRDYCEQDCIADWAVSHWAWS